MLPQPFVTTAQMKQPDVRVTLDLNAEWAALQEGSNKPSAMLTGVVVARSEFVENNPEAVEAFLAAYHPSVEFTNANVEEAAKIIGEYDIVPEAVAKTAVPFCSIVCIDGAEMQTKLSGYLKVLFDQNPKSVGGALPADDFYYSK